MPGDTTKEEEPISLPEEKWVWSLNPFLNEYLKLLTICGEVVVSESKRPNSRLCCRVATSAIPPVISLSSDPNRLMSAIVIVCPLVAFTNPILSILIDAIVLPSKDRTSPP